MPTQKYTRTVWGDGTPFTPDNMNNLENGVEEALNLTRYEVDNGIGEVKSTDFKSATTAAGNYQAAIDVQFAANRFSAVPKVTASIVSTDPLVASISPYSMTKDKVTFYVTRKDGKNLTKFIWQATNVTNGG